MTQIIPVTMDDNFDVSTQVPSYSGAISKVFKSEHGLMEIYKQYEIELSEWPVEYEEQVLHSTFGTTYCIMCGNPNNPPLVMIHGLGVNSTSFHNNIEQLSRKFRVYLLDFPGGSGRSVPSQLMLKKRDVAAWLTDTISQIENRQVTVLGASFGSWVAVEYALTKPKQLAKLILTAPPPLAGKAKLKISTLMKMIFLGLNKNKKNMEKLCKLLSAPNYIPDNRTVTAIYNGLKYTKSFKESGHTIKKNLANEIMTPIHFIMGEHDMLCDPASLPNHFPKAHISIIENAGHLVGIEQSNNFNQLIIESMAA